MSIGITPPKIGIYLPKNWNHISLKIDMIRYNTFVKQYLVGENESGQRLDRYIRRILDRASWTEIQKLIRKRVFKLNGVRTKEAGLFVHLGDVLEIYLSDESFASLSSLSGTASGSSFWRESGESRTASAVSKSAVHVREDPGNEDRIQRGTEVKKGYVGETARNDGLPEAQILYEDEAFLVVNKPRGMLIHSNTPGGEDDLTCAVKRYLQVKSAFFSPSTASRLDRGTSGVVVFAKTYEALKRMNEEMRARRVERKYVCIVEGALGSSGVVEGRLVKDRGANRVSVVEDGTITFRTHYRAERIARNGDYSLVSAELETGRSHQIRVSMQSLGHPIVGDRKYGSKYRADGFLLHCREVVLLGRTFTAESEDLEQFIKLHF